MCVCVCVCVRILNSRAAVVLDEVQDSQVVADLGEVHGRVRVFGQDVAVGAILQQEAHNVLRSPAYRPGEVRGHTLEIPCITSQHPIQHYTFAGFVLNVEPFFSRPFFFHKLHVFCFSVLTLHQGRLSSQCLGVHMGTSLQQDSNRRQEVLTERKSQVIVRSRGHHHHHLHSSPSFYRWELMIFFPAADWLEANDY